MYLCLNGVILATANRPCTHCRFRCNAFSLISQPKLADHQVRPAAIHHVIHHGMKVLPIHHAIGAGIKMVGGASTDLGLHAARPGASEAIAQQRVEQEHLAMGLVKQKPMNMSSTESARVVV